MPLLDCFYKESKDVKKLNYVSDDSKLKLYGLYKQATIGDVNCPRPSGIFNIKEKAKYDATDLLETKKLENRFFSVITSSEAQIEAEKKVQSTQLESRRHHLPWRDILAAAILLLCVGTFAWAVNSILQFFG